MINIDDDDLDEETFEDRIYDKADAIGEILTGERKIKFKMPKKEVKPIIKIKKPSKVKTFFGNLKESLIKYRKMSLSRIIGLGILFLLTTFIISIVVFLLLTLMTSLLSLGLIGFIIFIICICSLCISSILILVLKFK